MQTKVTTDTRATPSTSLDLKQLVEIRSGVFLNYSDEQGAEVIVSLPDQDAAKARTVFAETNASKPLDNTQVLAQLAQISRMQVSPLLRRFVNASFRQRLARSSLIRDAASSDQEHRILLREVLRSLRRLFRFDEFDLNSHPGSSIPVRATDKLGSYIVRSTDTTPEWAALARQRANEAEATLRQRYTGVMLPVATQTRIARIQKSLQRYEQFLSLAREGKSARRIAQKLGLDINTAVSWMTEPKAFNPLGGQRSFADEYARPLDASTLDAEKKAFLLGALLLGRNHCGTRRLTIRVYDTAALQLLDKDMQHVLKSDPGSCRISSTSPSGGTLIIHSRAFAHEIRLLTANRTAVPWEHLQTPECFVSFLKGALSVRGDFSNEQFGISCAGRPRLAVDLASVFAQVGIFPLVLMKGIPQVVITDTLSFQRLLELDLCQFRVDKPKLDSYVTKIDRKRRPSLRIEDYDRVKHFRHANPKASLSQIHAATGVAISTFRSWAKSTPHQVRRRNELLCLQNIFEVPNPAAFQAILSAAPHMSREMARRYASRSDAQIAELTKGLQKEKPMEQPQVAVRPAEKLPVSLTTKMQVRLEWLLDSYRSRRILPTPPPAIVDNQVRVAPSDRKSAIFSQAEKLAPKVAATCFKFVEQLPLGLSREDLVAHALLNFLKYTYDKFPHEQEIDNSLMFRVLKYEMIRTLREVNPRHGRALEIAAELSELTTSLTATEVAKRFNCRLPTARRALAYSSTSDISLDAGDVRSSALASIAAKQESSGGGELRELIETYATPFERLFLTLRLEHTLSFPDLAFILDIPQSQISLAWTRFKQKVRRAQRDP